ncbi:MAG TPA: ATP-dependent DNA helicase, partial [Spirochaetia bacterium]
MPVPVELPSTLTADQRAAILHDDGPLLIIAGPGSGKTEVLTWRVARLVGSGAVPPDRFLVCTFTRKAALGLKDRIQQKLSGVDVEGMTIGTIHSLCESILREFESRSPAPRGFSVLDDEGQLLLVYDNRVELGLDGVLRGRPQDFFAAVLRTFNLATEELVPPGRLLDWCRRESAAARERAKEAARGAGTREAQRAQDAVELLGEEYVVVKAYEGYCGLLSSRGLVDFAFLQRHCLDLLEAHPEIVEELRRRFHHILVDEYQDTDAAQERILHLIAGDGAHLAVVGDDDQGIYRFRGATVGNLLGFETRYPGARRIYLRQNFRSREPIVHGSQTVIENNPARFSKELFTVRGPGNEVVLVHEHAVAEEAASIARFLAALKTAGTLHRWGDVALLLRSVRSHVADYLEAFSAAGIPVSVVGEASLFERPDIRGLVELLRFLCAPKSWADVVIRCAVMDLGEDTVRALQAWRGNLSEIDGDGELRQIGIVREEDRRRILRLTELKRSVVARKNESLLSVLYGLFSLTECVARRQESGDEQALMSLATLSAIVARFDGLCGARNLRHLLEYLELLAARGVEPPHPEPGDAVRVMTIHQAKGLEFPVVVLGSVMNGRLPSTRRHDRYEIPYSLRASGPPEVDDPHLIDERKLFYVGTTRARELLVLGTADVVEKRGGGPSPFLEEMLGDDLAAATAAGKARVLEVESVRSASHEPRERVSFSTLAYFLQCPVKYQLAVVYGFEVVRPAPEDFGARLHMALREIHEKARAGLDLDDAARGGLALDDAALTAAVDAAWGPSSDADEATVRDAKRAAAEYLRRYVREHAGDFGRIAHVELPFSFRMEETIV